MKIYFKYLPINLDKRGYYYPNHMVKVASLTDKAVIYDESNYPLQSPNTIYEYGFVDIVDATAQADVQDLVDTLGLTVGMKTITSTEFKTALSTNGYIETSTNVFEISPATTDINGDTIPAITLTID